MATGKVTKRTVDTIEKTDRTEFLWDDELRGFGLRVTSNGAKSYVYQYRLGGREAPKKRATIGKHGSPWTPTSARKEAERLAQLVGQGIDPAEHDRERRRQAVDLAFSTYAKLFVDGHLKTAWKDWEIGDRLLTAEAVPVLKAKALPAIKRSDIAAVLDRMNDRPAAARLAHATLRKLFKWAEGRGDLDRSPMDGMKAPAGVAARDRVLSDNDLALVWRGAGTLGYPFAPLFQLLIVTGQRREEVSGLAWSELDRASATWSLPANRAKNGQAHIVPLSPAAMEVIDNLARTLTVTSDDAAADPVKWPRKGLVFTTTGTTPVSGYSKGKTRLDTAIVAVAAHDAAAGARPEAVEAWRVHDLRRTMATGFQRLGVRFEVTEAVLNHVSGAKSGVAGVYQRHDWKDEKRTALDAWGRHVMALTDQPDRTNVVDLRATQERAA
jgi:integrase